MTITALSGPVISFGVTLSSTAGTGVLGNDLEHNSQRGPNTADLGFMMMDPRVAYAYQPGSGVGSKTVGLYGAAGRVDYVPAAITNGASAFVALAIVSTGVTTYTLAAASSANGTYSTTIIAPETGTVTGTLIAIDSTAAVVTFGSDGTVASWNPGAGTGRTISINKSSNLDVGSFTVAGRDMYGFKMTETITGNTSKNVFGVKAFKYISSITNCSAPTSTSVSIGFNDIYGFPLYVPYCGANVDIRILASAYSSVAAVLLSSANTALGSTATQTATTADVRGTYASSTASNGTVRLQMVITPSASGIAAITSTNVAPLFGQAQFSSV